MNPCPCGYLGATTRACRCTPEQIQRYRSRLSGPLLDRIDLQVEVPALPPEVLLTSTPGESSAVVRERVWAARARAEARQGCPNHALQGDALLAHALVLPAGSAEEAALVPGVTVVRVAHLRDVVQRFAAGEGQAADDAGSWQLVRAGTTLVHTAPSGPDLADVKGQAAARRALEVAAAGGHSLLLSGPPGSGNRCWRSGWPDCCPR